MFAVKPGIGTRAQAPSPLRWLRSLATFAALGLGLLIWSEDGDVRLGGAAGSGGGGDVSVALNTDTLIADDSSFLADLALPRFLSPRAAQPSYQGGSLGGLFNRPGLIGGFAAGFLGAGVLGLLFGHGMIGELSGMTSLLGLVFQLTLIVMLVRLIWTWWHTDPTAAFAYLSPRQLADAYGRLRHEALPDLDSASSGDAEAKTESFK